MTTTPPPAPHEQILQIMSGLFQSRALITAAELELAGALADGPLSVEALASRTKTHAPSLFRLMRALESIGVFRQVSTRVFANTPASDCLRKDVPASQWAFVRLGSVGGGYYEAWGGLTDSVRTGKIALNQVYGYDIWEFYRRNPDQWAIFNESFRSMSVAITPAVTAAYAWGRFPVIADIGGGVGAQVVDILNAHPSSRSILFDSPDVVAGGMVHDRLECIGGDLFQSVPAGADAYLLRFVLHDWADSEAATILRNVRQAMKADSRLAIIEAIMPETPEFTPGKWTDLIMMLTAGGRERTAAEYGALLSATGFEMEEIVPTSSPVSVILAKQR